MGARQRECSRRVIELRASPAGQRMALLACCWESAGDVIRILRAVVILLMATDAGAGCPLELAANVARIALEVRVRSY